MDPKEIAMQIVLKMLDRQDILYLGPAPDTSSQEKINQHNQKNIETVCNAYKTVYQTIKQADS